MPTAEMKISTLDFQIDGVAGIIGVGGKNPNEHNRGRLKKQGGWTFE